MFFPTIKKEFQQSLQSLTQSHPTPPQGFHGSKTKTFKHSIWPDWATFHLLKTLILFSLDLSIFLTKNRAFSFQFCSSVLTGTAVISILKHNLSKNEIIFGKRLPRKSSVRQLFPFQCRIFLYQVLWPSHFLRQKRKAADLPEAFFVRINSLSSCHRSQNLEQSCDTPSPFWFFGHSIPRFSRCLFHGSKTKIHLRWNFFIWCVEVPKISKYPLNGFLIFQECRTFLHSHYSNYRAFLSLQI